MCFGCFVFGEIFVIQDVAKLCQNTLIWVLNWEPEGSFFDVQF